MEIFTSGIGLLKNFVTLVGAAFVILGLIQFFSGQGDNNAASKQTGVGLFAAGAGIIMVAQTLIPMLANITG
ncbi:MAG: Maff2 family protein [Angelakisella sp.]